MAYDDNGQWQEDEQPQQQQPQYSQAPTPAMPPQAPPQAPATNPFNYDQFREGWLTAGFGNQTSPEQVAQHAAKWGVTIRNGDKAYDPQGNFIADLVGDVGGRNTLQFLRGPEGHATSARYAGKPAPKGKVPKGGKGPISPPGPGNLPPGGGGGTPPGTPPARDARWDELYNQLMQRSTQGLNVDPNDPVIKAQTDAYAAQEERARRNYMSDLAEKQGPLANLQGEQRMAAERMGQNVGSLQANLMGKELASRRDEIAQALQSRQGMLTFEQQQALQLQLAQMDDAIKRLSLSQSDRHFNKSLAQSDRHFGADLGYRYAGLNQADEQFRDKLGFEYGDRSNYWDAVNRGILG